VTAATRSETRGPLSRYRILDMTSLRGAIGPQMLAQYGADVIHVEPPTGDPMRHEPPFAGDVADPERSLLFLWRNLGKRGVTIDLGNPEGKRLFERLSLSADVLYESFDPGMLASLGLGWSRLHEINPRLVHVSITEYGEDGPYAHWKGSTLTAFAMSGAMQVSGTADHPPCNAPHPIAYDAAAVYANAAVMMALWARHSTGEGQHIEISAQEAAIGGLHPWAVPIYSFGNGGKAATALNRRGGISATIYECRDGWVRVPIIGDRFWPIVRKILGEPEALMASEWEGQAFRTANEDLLHTLITEQTMKWATEALVAAAKSSGLPIAAVRPPSGFMKDPNTLARGFWREVEHPVAGRAVYPSTPVRMSASRLEFGRPAPRLGEHNDEVFSGIGLSREEILQLRAVGAI
jgi:crotonobetainyl-CoA:carnitine CoA-transferase CaiB-like acyl-CoA transferase